MDKENFDSISDIKSLISDIDQVLSFMKSRKHANSIYGSAINGLEYYSKFYKSLIPSCMNCSLRDGKAVKEVDQINENIDYYNAPDFMTACKINGIYPKGFNLDNYCCKNWLFDDIPF